MGWLWDTISRFCRNILWYCFGPGMYKSEPPKRCVPAHVRFSPSTLRRQQVQQLEKLASTNPYFNFLMFYNIYRKQIWNGQTLQMNGLNYFEFAHSVPAACDLWSCMSTKNRAPYVELAQRVRKRSTNNFLDKRALKNLGNRTHLQAFCRRIHNDKIVQDKHTSRSAFGLYDRN